MPSMVLWLHQVGLLLDEVMQDRLRDLDLTTLEGHVLVLAAQRSAGVTVHELRTNLGISSARMSAILRSLQQFGLVDRSVDGLDRRFVVVSLTPLGREAARLVRDAADDLEERLVDGSLSDDIRLGYAVADIIMRSPWVGPGRPRIRMPDWS